MTWLVDASVLMAAHLRDEPQHAVACDFLQRAAELWLCSITTVELVNALAGAVRRGRLAATDALAAERGIRALALPVVAVSEQLPAVLQVSLDGLGHPYDLLQVFAARAHGLRWVSLGERQLLRLQGTPLADAVRSLAQAVAEQA